LCEVLLLSRNEITGRCRIGNRLPVVYRWHGHDPETRKESKMAEKETLIVASKVKAALREKDVNVGEGTLETLNGLMHWYLDQAALRAKANGRKTVRAHDIIMMEAYK
jgi:histone H3/H4